ncbi:MAG TPA: DUF58 domain-containing protein [Candidatus Aquilonibacter sp.]|nr:DUF58 domain-containing protein [Candidatus Aquilonibacter sp.]
MAKPKGRLGRWAAFALTGRSLLLFFGGLLLAIPAFWHPREIGFMLGWDALLAALCVVDAVRLPRPESLTVTRRFLDSPQLGEPTRVEITVQMDADTVADMRVVDDLHPALVAQPETRHMEVFPREDVVSTQTIWPAERGDYAMGSVYLRYRGALQLVERWAVAEPVVSGNKPQRVRVFPAHEDSRGRAAFFLLRARQIELQRRKLQLRGTGREFESLRDFQQGDELRSISWTATARRGKLVARQFTAERSQQVWVVLDAGRLSRTAFELRRGEPELVGETVMERERSHRMTVTQLDQAATAAVMLAQVVGGSGDKFAMMAYGREVRQVLPAGAGVVHTRLLLDLLSQTRAEAAEADHLNAVGRLKTLQRRRGLMIWITELVDSAGKPELVTAASDLVRRHLVVLVLLKHPELEELATRVPKTRDEMFHSTAAQEMLERRRETIAQLERQGVLIVETTAEEIGVRAVSEYLEVKARGLL